MLPEVRFCYLLIIIGFGNTDKTFFVFAFHHVLRKNSNFTFILRNFGRALYISSLYLNINLENAVLGFRGLLF